MFRTQDSEIGFSFVKIRGAIFDLDGTLYSQKNLRRAMALHLVAAFRTRPLAGYRTFRTVQAYRQAHEELRGNPYSTDLQISAAAALCRGDRAEVREIVAQWFDAAPLKFLANCVYPGLSEFISLLSRHNIACGVFSDYPPELKLDAMGLRQYFPHTLCANEAGFQKPNPAGLGMIAKKMHIEPAEAVYFGDRILDIEAAHAAGMNGYLIEGARSWRVLHSRLLKTNTV